MTLLRGFPPVVDERARVLILGSFPSTASLAAGQYYAHKQNQFWRVLAAVLAKPLPEMDYADRLVAVKDAGMAIWDVYASCRREGSLDAAIRDAVPNDFRSLMARLPRLRRICFNGREAARWSRFVQDGEREIVILPSTSPANAGWSFERKLAAWREALVTGT